MKTYQSYKNSGEDYIGEIPEHWECIRLGMLGVFSSSGIDKKTNENEVSVKMVNYTDIIQSRIYYPIQSGEKEYMVVSTPSTKLEEHRLVKGDMVFIPSSETKDDLGYSSLIDFDETDIVYSYHILRYRTRKPIFHYFKKYLINHHSVLNQFSRDSKGTTRQIIGRNVFNNVRVVLPPLQEQEQIVNFLDEKTSIIDKLISTKERKIELLKEQRSSLINEVITKGLDPNVKMTDSGVEWIGEIPESWSLICVKHLVSTKITDGPHETPIFVDNGVPFLSVESVQDGKLDFNKKRGYISIELNKIYSKKCLPKKDDVLIVKSGSTTGKSTIVETDEIFNIWSPLCIVRSNQNKIIPKFTFTSVQSNYFRKFIELGWSFGTQPNIGMGVIENLKLVVPSTIQEQQEIVEYLDKHTKEIDDLVQMEQKKIELLKEYRQSLISEVITGKIKVVE
jgi:type I restriction enzyme S subunit